MDNLSIEKTVNQEAIVLNVYNATAREELQRVLKAEELERNVLIFDFSKTKGISSNFISEIVHVYKHVKKANGRCLISAMNKRVEDVFSCMGLLNLFEVVS